MNARTAPATLSTILPAPGASVVATMSSRDFNQDTAAAKRLALTGPVVITDRGQPSHVLLSYAEFERLTGSVEMSLGAALGSPEVAEIDFDPEHCMLPVRPAEF